MMARVGSRCQRVVERPVTIGRVTVDHVRRESNGEADRPGHEAMDEAKLAPRAISFASERRVGERLTTSEADPRDNPDPRLAGNRMWNTPSTQHSPRASDEDSWAEQNRHVVCVREQQRHSHPLCGPEPRGRRIPIQIQLCGCCVAAQGSKR